MSRIATVLATLMVGLMLGGPVQAGSAKDEIEAGNAEFVAAFASKDAAAVAAHYTEDAQALPPNEAPIVGRANIQKMWQGWIDAGLTDLTLKATEVEEAGDLAYEVGAYSVKVPGKDGKSVDDVGKYVVVWKRGADGKWRLHRDIWNSDPAKQ